MTTDRFIRVLRYDLFGDIVRRWAAGQDPVPVTVGDFRAAVSAAIAEVGPGYKDDEALFIARMPAMEDQLSLVLPDTRDLEGALPAGNWPLPDFYSVMAFEGAAIVVEEADKEAFKSSRIADYCVAKCM